MKRLLLRLLPLLVSFAICFATFYFIPRSGADGFFYSISGFASVTCFLVAGLSFAVPPLRNPYLAVISLFLGLFMVLDPALWNFEWIGPLWILLGGAALISPVSKARAIGSLIAVFVGFVLTFFPSTRAIAYGLLALTGIVNAFLAERGALYVTHIAISLAFFIASISFLPGKEGISFASALPPIVLVAGLNYGLLGNLYKNKLENLEIAEKETTLSRIEEKALKEEIQPHFLLNALNNVRVAYHESSEKGKIQLGELRELEERIYQTIDIPFIPLSEEIEIIRSLIALHNTDVGGSVELVLEVADSSLPVPPMLLEPLVENSLQHSGISRQEGGQVAIKQWEEYGIAFILVSDNGKGLPLPSSSRGIGLSNVNKRVSLLENGHMEIDSDESGTRIEIRFVPHRNIDA